MEAFGKCFYYGYEFELEIDSETRTKFIQYVKFSSSIQKDEDLSHFIQKAINDLNAKINLYDYDLVIYPESSSQVNQYMLRYIYRFAQPTLRTYEIKLKSINVPLVGINVYRKEVAFLTPIAVNRPSMIR